MTDELKRKILRKNGYEAADITVGSSNWYIEKLAKLLTVEDAEELLRIVKSKFTLVETFYDT